MKSTRREFSRNGNCNLTEGSANPRREIARVSSRILATVYAGEGEEQEEGLREKVVTLSSGLSSTLRRIGR